MSEVQLILLIHCCKYMVAILTYIDNLILYGQISPYHFVSQPSDTTKNVVNCINWRIKLKDSTFERNAKKILGFESFLSRIRDIEKKLPLKSALEKNLP